MSTEPKSDGPAEELVSPREGAGRIRAAWGFAGAGILLLTLASFFLARRELPWTVAAVLGIGLGLTIASVVLLPPPRRIPEALDAAGSGRRAWLALPALLAAAAAWRALDSDDFSTPAVVAWTVALALWLAAWWPRRFPLPPRSEETPGRRRRVVMAFLAVLAIGAVFRFYRLDRTPGDPDSDHVQDLLNLVDMDSGQRPVFFPRNTGQPPLPFDFTFLLHRLGLPLHHLTLKTSTAIVGMAAIPAAYLLGAELGGAALGLLTAALLAWGKWTVFGARRGLTFPWAVFPAALVLWALLRYMRRGDRGSALHAGLWLGLGQYGYNAFKIVPVMVPVVFAFLLFDRRWRGRRSRLGIDALLLAATAFLVFLPLLHYMVRHPDLFWYRMLTRAGSRERALPGPALLLFLGNLARMALAFHWRGDTAWINTVALEPFLDPVTGALLLAGGVAAVALAIRGSARWAVVLLSLFFLTLASTLSIAFPIENPGINRAAVAAPSVYALAGLGALRAALLASAAGATLRRATAAALAVLFALSIAENARSYFVRYDEQNRRMIDPIHAFVAVIREERARGIPMQNMYVLSRGNWVDPRTIAFELDETWWGDSHNVAPGAPVPQLTERPLLFFFHADDWPVLGEELRRKYPSGSGRIYPQFHRDRNFGVYVVR